MPPRTTPDPNQTKFPGGIPYIIGNEFAERFSFYGMRTILTVFMTKHLLDAAGQPAYMDDENAKAVFHLFLAAAYFFPIIGAMISDVLLGKYRTILYISLMYCVGHACLALMDLGPTTGLWDMKPFLFIGLALIAIGAGGIKPCVSAHVGDQFGSGNRHLITKIFNWFYFSINVGAAISSMLTPILLNKVGPWLAFGLPGVLMALATFVFWLGRNKFVHVPASGWKRFKEETFSPEGIRAIKNLAPLFLIFVPMFWAIFDQTASAWVLQAKSMNREFLGMTWLESQVQVVNPVLILTLIPVFAYVVYPAMGRLFAPTPLRKIGIGFMFTIAACVISAFIETSIGARAPEAAALLSAALGHGGEPGTLSEVLKAATAAGWDHAQIAPHLASMPNIGWQFFAYLILTAGEIMVSIVCLEFAYTQSPRKMKSFIMGVYMLGISLGNLFVSGVNFGLAQFKNADGTVLLQGANYYWFFGGLMALATTVYLPFARRYKGETFVQGEE